MSETENSFRKKSTSNKMKKTSNLAILQWRISLRRLISLGWLEWSLLTRRIWIGGSVRSVRVTAWTGTHPVARHRTIAIAILLGWRRRQWSLFRSWRWILHRIVRRWKHGTLTTRGCHWRLMVHKVAGTVTLLSFPWLITTRMHLVKMVDHNGTALERKRKRFSVLTENIIESLRERPRT